MADSNTTTAPPAAGVLLGERKPDLKRDLLTLLALLAISLPVLLVNVGTRDSTHTMENIAVLSAQETWLRQRGTDTIERDPDAWKMPTRNGAPRVTKPPLFVWGSMLTWMDLEAGEASTPLLLYRARLGSVVTGVVMLIAIYWMGLTLFDRKTAALALLVAASCWFFQRQARTASYDIYLSAFAALGTSAGLWAIAPFRAKPGLARELSGWVIAGVAVAAGWMSKNPLGLAVSAIPLAIVVAVLPERRVRALLGLALCAVVAAALALPWHIWAAATFKEAEDVWGREFRAKRPEFQPVYYYVGLFGLMVPWTVWLIAGLIQPFFSRSRSGFSPRTRQLLVSWILFVFIFVLFSIPGAKQQRYILPIVPAAAMLIAAVFAEHEWMARRGERDPGAAAAIWPHWIALSAVAVLFGPFLLLQDWMISQEWMEHRPIGPVDSVGLPVVILGCLGLMVSAALGFYWHLKWKPMRAGYATAAWAMCLTLLAWPIYAHNDRGEHPIRPEAEKVAELAGTTPIYRLVIHETHKDLINEEFLLYSQRIIPDVTSEGLTGLVEQHGDNVFVMAKAEADYEAAMTQAGWEKVLNFKEDKRLRDDLWKPRGAE